jgi:hypothetical protein
MLPNWCSRAIWSLSRLVFTDEHVRLTRSGKQGAPITFVADPPGSVILTGADPITGWERVDGNAPIYRVPWKHRFVINRRPDGSLVEHHPDDERHKLWGRAELVIVDGKLCLPALSFYELRLAWHRHAEAIRNGKPSPILQPPLPNLGGPFAGMFYADTKTNGFTFGSLMAQTRTTIRLKRRRGALCLG